MVIIGAVVMLQGFGSAIARAVFHRDFGLLHLLPIEDSQPWLGIGVGAIGLLITAAGLRGRDRQNQ